MKKTVLGMGLQWFWKIEAYMIKMDGWMDGVTNFQSCFSHWSYALYCRFSVCISHIWRNWGAYLEGHRMVPLIPFPLPCPSSLTSSELSPHCRKDSRGGCCSFALPLGSYRYLFLRTWATQFHVTFTFWRSGSKEMWDTLCRCHSLATYTWSLLSFK